MNKETTSNNKRIYLSSPHMSEEAYELNYIKEAFDTNWIAPLGPNVDEFEKEFADKLKIKHAAALSSGTAAIHLALKAVGVGTGDIVLCQSLTFSATANPIIYQNATPVFIDSDYTTWNMDPNLIEEALQQYGDKVKAIIIVHLYGLSADIDRIMALSKKYNVPVIEDAAESLGTLYKGKHTGTIGDYGIYSFNGNKIITTSGGGILVSNNEEKIKKARFWATQSRDPARHYQHSELGYNYRMSNITAGIGRGQLKILDNRVAKKRYIFEYYKRELGGLDGVQFMPINEWNDPNCWLTCITLNGCHSGENFVTCYPKGNSVNCHSERSSTNCHSERSEESSPLTPLAIMEALEKENIESRPIWKPMHLQPFFEKYDYIGGNISETLFKNGICLPSDTKMTDEDLERVCEIIKRLF